MKKIQFALLMLFAPALASAQSYMGAVVAINKFSIGCAANNTCENKKGGFQLRAGSKLDSSSTLDFGGVFIDTIEVGASKFGRKEASGFQTESYYSGGVSAPTQRVVPISNAVSANAVYAAFIAHAPLTDEFAVTGKAGLAYVATTSRSTYNSLSYGSVTENHFSPLLGLGVEYAVIDAVKIVGGVEVVKFKSNSQSGKLSALTVGAQFGF